MLDAQIKKEILKSFHYGLFVLTINSRRNITAATVTWVSQASFEPPLLMIAVKKSSNSFRNLQDQDYFALNIIGEGQQEIAKAFFKETAVANHLLNGFPFILTEMNQPCLTDAPYVLECLKKHVYDEGDHAVIIGEITSLYKQKTAAALSLKSTGWSYGG
jgi:flavin reductase (DIM6/NTAB) family NADH-FMN oxidoreductase RutF